MGKPSDTPESSDIPEQVLLRREELEEIELQHPGVIDTIKRHVKKRTDAMVYPSFFRPVGLESANLNELPDHVKKSFEAGEKLSPDKQVKISYYEKNGEWFIDINGIKMSLQNESAQHNPENGINVINGYTYFSQVAARVHATSKGKSLPTNVLWSRMADFLGGYNQLADILQIPFVGWFHSVDNQPHVGNHGYIWSAEDGNYLRIAGHGSGTQEAGDPLYGVSVRLLDN